jgi:hypothetical protein
MSSVCSDGDVSFAQDMLLKWFILDVRGSIQERNVILLL